MRAKLEQTKKYVKEKTHNAASEELILKGTDLLKRVPLVRRHSTVSGSSNSESLRVSNSANESPIQDDEGQSEQVVEEEETSDHLSSKKKSSKSESLPQRLARDLVSSRITNVPEMRTHHEMEDRYKHELRKLRRIEVDVKKGALYVAGLLGEVTDEDQLIGATELKLLFEKYADFTVFTKKIYFLCKDAVSMPVKCYVRVQLILWTSMSTRKLILRNFGCG